MDDILYVEIHVNVIKPIDYINITFKIDNDET